MYKYIYICMYMCACLNKKDIPHIFPLIYGNGSQPILTICLGNKHPSTGQPDPR